jgi:hypothetical protein
MQYSQKGEKGYSLFFFHLGRQWMTSAMVSLAILVVGTIFFLWSIGVSSDRGGDSFAGLVFAVASTTFMLMAAVGFSMRRRARRRVIGELNAVLNWHVCFATISLVFVFYHAFGNYNPRTGTYALYGMVALVISGIIGRILDRMMPRMIAQKVSKVLTSEGEDRAESLSRTLISVAQQGSRPSPRSWGGLNPFSWPGISNKQNAQGGQDRWDMAYISKDTQQLLSHDNRQYPDVMASPDILYSGAQQHMAAMERIEQTFKQETFFRGVIRFWRIFHILLAVVTVGLTLWHIEYALSLIFPALQHYGFSYLLPWP